jgi:putative flippase GtrA
MEQQIEINMKCQFFVFLIIGLLSVSIDYVLYQLIMNLSLSICNQAKLISFVIGMVFSFFANKTWTFSFPIINKRLVCKFLFLYALALCINVIINSIILNVITGAPFAINLAFLFATLSSAIFNFMGMKFFVFKTEMRHS